MGSEGFEFSTRVWNWKAAVEIIKRLDILSEGTIRQLGHNAIGVAVASEDAHHIGREIRDRILPQLEPDKRMFADGTVTHEPDDGTIHKDEDEQWKNYSVSYEWLKEFSDFCLRSKGFKVY